jgi:hypothetical protein
MDGCDAKGAARHRLWNIAGVTWLSVVLSLFPALVTFGAGFLVVKGLATGTLSLVALGIASVYLVPLAAYRVHDRAHPLVEGRTHIAGGPYSPWWGGHQIQLVFIAFPVLEAALRLVPGLFSLWLRAWGSKVGARVYWTPALRLGDRALLDVGDDVIFGYDVGISSHLVKKTRKNVLLYVRRVTVGAGAFIGAGAIIGPGAVVEEGAILDAGVHVYPNARVGRTKRARDAGPENPASPS